LPSHMKVAEQRIPGHELELKVTDVKKLTIAVLKNAALTPRQRPRTPSDFMIVVRASIEFL
jgi:hypothetical protein